MMNYRYINTTSHNGQDGMEVCNIVENNTNQVIKTGLILQKAKGVVRHLNMGGGFDGWTPTFFLNKIFPTGT